MNTPNKLTVARIIATPVFMITMLVDFPLHYLAALIIFIAASLTDMIDGKMARKHNLVTDFGKFLDPLADKMLTTSAYLGFIFMYRKSAVFTVIITAVTFIILFREFAVSSIRLVVVSSGGKVIAANIWGKSKTVSQMVGIIAALAIYMFKEVFSLLKLDFLPDIVWSICDWFIMGCFILSGVLCIISGMTYLLGAKDYINPSK